MLGPCTENVGLLYVLYLTVYLFAYVRLRTKVVRMIGWEILKTPTQNALQLIREKYKKGGMTGGAILKLAIGLGGLGLGIGYIFIVCY